MAKVGVVIFHFSARLLSTLVNEPPFLKCWIRRCNTIEILACFHPCLVSRCFRGRSQMFCHSLRHCDTRPDPSLPVSVTCIETHTRETFMQTKAERSTYSFLVLTMRGNCKIRLVLRHVDINELNESFSELFKAWRHGLNPPT